ncbi:hypothetical protein SISSUDRAFT_469829 [Sistotremastrum suecicum HHB10207 ss-3]|uniref:Uncharacterized protein n=1 Tax=Sistotremastrum suecicum HHB10207 ss-3 TaxID=1314776 RepID=A0A165Y5M2_9AGAM|nr:hypothetical protein SISSUDRAFT_469829 [Sistotremastrum suecicum HHB10207 ss-3]
MVVYFSRLIVHVVVCTAHSFSLYINASTWWCCQSHHLFTGFESFLSFTSAARHTITSPRKAASRSGCKSTLPSQTIILSLLRESIPRSIIKYIGEDI